MSDVKMINPLDMQRIASELAKDVALAYEAEKAALDYESYLQGDDEDNPDLADCNENISRLMELKLALQWFAGSKLHQPR